ncbi:acetyl-coenzyme A synthetase N-terminal domain-containing protein, partial [Novosphingobium mangrovi (ex Huang et al. 2023)]
MAEAVYPVSGEWSEGALIDNDRYLAMYRRSVDDPEGFWAGEARRIDWIKPFSTVKQTSFDEADFGISWFSDGTLNLSANCLDRHLATRGDAVAILWEPDDPKNPERRITYRELHQQVCKFANLLKSRGVKKGERVTIYLPMVPEAAV